MRQTNALRAGSGAGGAVKALLGADRVAEISGRYKIGHLTRIADQIGKTSLALRITDPNHPLHGVPVSRWSGGNYLLSLANAVEGIERVQCLGCITNSQQGFLA